MTTTTTVPTPIVLIDDHPLFTEGLRLLLAAAAADRIAVVGHTSDAAMASALVRRCRPEAAVVDLAMPPPGGLGAVRAIAREHPHVRVLVLSGVEDSGSAAEVLSAGAHGFLPKTAEPTELVHPLLALIEGCAVLSDALLATLLHAPAARTGALAVDLSDAEIRLWRLVAAGAETMAIAEHLHVSERTAKRQVAKLLRRLDVDNRVAAAALAGRAGVLDEGPVLAS